MSDFLIMLTWFSTSKSPEKNITSKVNSSKKRTRQASLSGITIKNNHPSCAHLALNLSKFSPHKRGRQNDKWRFKFRTLLTHIEFWHWELCEGGAREVINIWKTMIINNSLNTHRLPIYRFFRKIDFNICCLFMVRAENESKRGF